MPRTADMVTAVTDKKYRVILWGVGSIGGELLTAILDHRRDLEVVGVRVYSDTKNGVDAGTLVGRDPIGVAATTDVDEIVGLDADCVIYTPRNGDLDEICTLLASGKNVATTVFLFYPPRLPDADRERLEAACREGSSTLHASGINPGNLAPASVISASVRVYLRTRRTEPAFCALSPREWCGEIRIGAERNPDIPARERARNAAVHRRVE